MNVIARQTVDYYAFRYPAAAVALMVWYEEFRKAEFKNFNDLKAMFGAASLIGGQRVVFNVKGNEFRLLVSVHFRKAAAYVIWFGTHKEYDKTDMANIPFDTRILDSKFPKS